MTKIKICGLRSEEDISYVNELCPDYVGFVFLEGRRRYISPPEAAGLRKRLDPAIQSVGVFVDEPVENVAALLKEGTIQLAQLHGREDEEYARKLKRLCDKPVIKAFIIRTPADVEEALAYPADYLPDVCPYGVDVSSGVETEGRKDYQKIKAFIESVRKKI